MRFTTNLRRLVSTGSSATSRRRTSSINIRNFIGTTSLRTSRPLSITSMLPRVGVGGLQASTTTYFVRSVSCAFRSHSGKSRHANGGRPDRAAEAGDNRAFHGTTCQAALSREEHPPALPQLVAIDDCALSARHVVEDAALDKRVYARVAEQDQRCTIIIAARIARDLPSLREQLVDRQRCLRCRQAGRRQQHADVPLTLALLRSRREWPRRRRAAEQRDELPLVHSITSSARASSLSGIWRPSALAVLILTISSYFVGDCTGKSAGFSPRKMRSTYEPVRRKMSDGSGPYETRLPSNTNCR